MSKSTFIHVRVTPEEKLAIEEAAKGLGVSQYIRSVLLGHTQGIEGAVPLPKRPDPPPTADDFTPPHEQPVKPKGRVASLKMGGAQ